MWKKIIIWRYGGVKMNIRKLSTLTCKVISIYILIKFVMYLQNIFITFAYIDSALQVDKNMVLIGTIIPGVMLLVLSILFWLFASRIGKMIIDSDDQEELSQEIDFEKLEILAFSVIGLVILSSGLSNLVKSSIDIYTLKMSYVIGSYKDDIRFLPNVLKVIGDLIQIIIGFWLLLGSKGVVGLIKTLRKA